MAYVKIGYKRDYSYDQIMDKCPETIDKDTIPTKPIGGMHRHKNPPGRLHKGHRNQPWYSEEMRIKAACVYAVTGSAAETGRILGIKSTTIRQWKMQPWWPQVIERIRSEKDDEIDVKMTAIIDETVAQINDRLKDGDYIYDVRTGELKRKPMGGKEIAVVTSIMIDKRNLIRQRRAVRTEETAVLDRLKNLAKEFAGFVKAKDITKEATVVDEQDTEQAEATTR